MVESEAWNTAIRSSASVVLPADIKIATSPGHPPREIVFAAVAFLHRSLFKQYF